MLKGYLRLGKAAKAIVLGTIFIIAVVAISIFLTGWLQNNNSNKILQNNDLATITPSNPTPTTQPLSDQPQVHSYTGYLVSFNYVTSQTNGIEYTQLVFTNKTFNYPGYISIDNNCVYNVTYNDRNPNQALSLTKIDLTIGFMGNSEQVSITNIAFIPGTTDTLQITVTNSGTTQATISKAFINGIDASTNIVAYPSLQIAKTSSATVTLDVPIGVGGLTAGTAYQVKLITEKGNSVVNTATYNP